MNDIDRKMLIDFYRVVIILDLFDFIENKTFNNEIFTKEKKTMNNILAELLIINEKKYTKNDLLWLCNSLKFIFINGYAEFRNNNNLDLLASVI
jgi:hypothetical protein